MQLVEDIINRKSIKVMEHRLPKISEFYLCCNISDLQVSTYNQLLLEGADKFNIIGIVPVIFNDYEISCERTIKNYL